MMNIASHVTLKAALLQTDNAGMMGGQWMFYLKEAFDEFNADMRPS